MKPTEYFSWRSCTKMVIPVWVWPSDTFPVPSVYGTQRKQEAPWSQAEYEHVCLHPYADLAFARRATACLWIIQSFCAHTWVLSVPAVNLYQMHPNHSTALFFSTLWSFIFPPGCLFDPYLPFIPHLSALSYSTLHISSAFSLPSDFFPLVFSCISKCKVRKGFSLFPKFYL